MSFIDSNAFKLTAHLLNCIMSVHAWQAEYVCACQNVNEGHCELEDKEDDSVGIQKRTPSPGARVWSAFECKDGQCVLQDSIKATRSLHKGTACYVCMRRKKRVELVKVIKANVHNIPGSQTRAHDLLVSTLAGGFSVCTDLFGPVCTVTWELDTCT